MRYLFLLLFAATACESHAGVFLVVDDAGADAPPTIENPQDALQLGVVNTGATPVTFQNVQVSLSIVPLPDATGEITLGVGQAASPLFSFPPGPPLLDSGGIVTSSVGALPLTPTPALASGEAAGVFALTLSPSATASGSFQIVASSLTADPLLSTNFVSPPDFLVPLAFDNTVDDLSGQVLLATVVISTVPEPAAAGLMLVGCFGLMAGRKQFRDQQKPAKNVHAGLQQADR